MVTADSLLAPVGPIDGGLLFQEEPAAVRARLDGYIAAGNAELAKALGNVTNGAAVTDAQKDDVVRTYAVWRSYDAVVDRLAASPASFTAADEGGYTVSSAQIRVMENKRDAAFEQYTLAAATLNTATAAAVDMPTPTSAAFVRFYP